MVPKADPMWPSQSYPFVIFFYHFLICYETGYNRIGTTLKIDKKFTKKIKIAFALVLKATSIIEKKNIKQLQIMSSIWW